MKILKRITAYLLIFTMMIGIFPTDTVMAEDTQRKSAQISVDRVNAFPGDTVKVNVMIRNNPGILGSALELEFGQGLELVDVVNGEAFSKLSLTKPGVLASPCRFFWSGVEILGSDIQDGAILELSFKVSENIEAGTQIPVRLSYADGDIIDGDLKEVNVSITDGYVSVDDYEPGDLNGDKKVNTLDVILLSRYIAGGYDVTIDERAADVNADQRINTLDVILISRYITGGYGVELKPSPGNPSSKEHSLQKVDFLAATCTEEGHIAYWQCADCGKYFSDEEGRHELSSDSIVVPAAGHTVVTDPAVEPTADTPGLTEGSHCAVCGEVIVPQKEWKENFFTLKYNIAGGDSYLSQLKIENTNPVTIKEGASMWLTDLETDGYEFLGWYDSPSEKANRIQKIENADHSMTLYAHWSSISYKIQFKSDLVPVSETTYTAKEGKVLPAPALDGYTFVGWTDFEGKEYKQIRQGTTGDITLYANWLSERNQAWAKTKLGDPVVYEDDNYILFAYEIGEVRNIPVYTVEDFGKITSDGVSQTVTRKYTVTTQETLMDSYAKALEKATTDSATWTLSKDWTDSVTVNEEYCKQNGITVEEAIARSQSESGNWYVSNSQGGAYSKTVVDSTDTYALHTENNNTKSWSDDYQQKVKHGQDIKEYDTTNKTTGFEVNGKYQRSGKASAGVEGFGSAEVSSGFEIGGEYDNHKTKNTGTETTTKGSDTTTMRGEAYDNTSSDQTGTVKNHSENTVNSRTWNTESGYGGSSTVSQNQSVAKALSQMISAKTGYGSSYINREGETSSQGLSSSTSQSDQYSSAVTYSKLTSEEKEVTYTTNNTKAGYHRWVLAGTAHVFGVVGYDIANKSYFVYSYSIMDDEYQRFEDYSYKTGAYDDNQSGVIPFEIPDDINDLVNQRVFETDGLEVDLDGTITAYTGSDSYVAIPDYKIVNHKDGTKLVVRVTGLATNAFRGNKDITGVKLSQYIKEIPDYAFEGCSNLWEFDASATKIGTGAFKDCPLLNEWSLSSDVVSLGDHAFDGADVFTVKAYDTDIVEGALRSGAKEITIGLSELDGSTEKKTLQNRTLTVPAGTQEFYLNGYGQEYKNLSIQSDAGKTVLNRVNITTDKGIPLQLDSSEIFLNQSTIKSEGIGLVLTADHVTLDLYGISNVITTGPNAMFCRDAELIRTSTGLKTNLNLTGNLVTCGTISDPNKFLKFETGGIVTVSREDFDKMLRSFTLTFDANGGNCDIPSMVVDNSAEVGTLPTAYREGYDLDGWYLSDGSMLTSDKIFSTGENQTAVAHWKVKEFTANWKSGNGARITVTRTASPIKDAAAGVIGSGDSIYFGDVLSVSYEAENGYMLGDTGNTTFEVAGNLTSDDIYACVGKLSGDWVLESSLPQGAAVLDEKWTYDQKTTITSGNSSADGYTLDHSTWVWGDYGNWTGWTNTRVDGSDSRQVETRNIAATYKTQYNYSRYTQYSNNSGWTGPIKGTWSGRYCQYYFEKGWSDTAMSVTEVQYSNQVGGNFNIYGGSGNHWYNQVTRQVQVTAAYTQYRYRDRSKIYTYYLTRTDQKEATERPEEKDGISNIRRWVKYVEAFVKVQ